jgi:hypothetical protein
MQRSALFLAIAVAALGTASTDAWAKQPKAGHKFKGSVEVQYRTNNNISVAPSSGERFDYAELSEFGIEDEEDLGADDSKEEDEDEGDAGDDFGDLIDVEPSEDEIEEDDAVDEDGDGIDDLIDPDDGGVVDSESRFTTKVGLAHKYTFASGTTSWNNGIRFATDTHNQRDDLDKFNWAVTTGFDFSPAGSKHGFKPSLSYVALDKDNNKFATTFVVSLGYTYEVSERLGLSATYNYQDKDISKPTAPDARVDTLAFGADFKATDDDIFKLKYAPKVEDSTQVTRNTDAWGWELTYTRKLPWDMTAGVGYKFDSVNHKNLSPSREDDNTTWGVQLTKDVGKWLSLEVGYETRDRESSIQSKDASNDSAFIGATWKF